MPNTEEYVKHKPKECYGCKSNAPDDYYDTIVNPEPSLICEDTTQV